MPLGLIEALVLITVFVYGVFRTVKFKAEFPEAKLNLGRIVCMASVPFLLPRLIAPWVFFRWPSAAPTIIRLFVPFELSYRFGLLLIVIAVPLMIRSEILRRRKLATLRTQLHVQPVDKDAWPPPPSTGL